MAQTLEQKLELTVPDLNRARESAEGAARKAGALLRVRPDDLIKTVRTERRDMKIAADLRAEEVIRAALTAADFGPVLGEEAGWSGGDGRTFWIVDPLDGTVNYSRGLALNCVSIALVHDDQIVLGVVYDFNRDELFSGGGDSALCNGHPMRVNQIGDSGRAILATGLPAAHGFDRASLTAFSARVAAFHKVRMLGSAALSLAYVANGQFDAYHEQNIMPWDVAAGVALVRAAGGAVSWSGTGYSNPVTVSAACSRELVAYLSSEIPHDDA